MLISFNLINVIIQNLSILYYSSSFCYMKTYLPLISITTNTISEGISYSQPNIICYSTQMQPPRPKLISKPIIVENVVPKSSLSSLSNQKCGYDSKQPNSGGAKPSKSHYLQTLSVEDAQQEKRNRILRQKSSTETSGLGSSLDYTSADELNRSNSNSRRHSSTSSAAIGGGDHKNMYSAKYNPVTSHSAHCSTMVKPPKNVDNIHQHHHQYQRQHEQQYQQQHYHHHHHYQTTAAPTGTRKVSWRNLPPTHITHSFVSSNPYSHSYPHHPVSAPPPPSQCVITRGFTRSEHFTLETIESSGSSHANNDHNSTPQSINEQNYPLDYRYKNSFNDNVGANLFHFGAGAGAGASAGAGISENQSKRKQLVNFKKSIEFNISSDSNKSNPNNNSNYQDKTIYKQHSLDQGLIKYRKYKSYYNSDLDFGTLIYEDDEQDDNSSLLYEDKTAKHTRPSKSCIIPYESYSAKFKHNIPQSLSKDDTNNEIDNPDFYKDSHNNNDNSSRQKWCHWSRERRKADLNARKKTVVETTINKNLAIELQSLLPSTMANYYPQSFPIQSNVAGGSGVGGGISSTGDYQDNNIEPRDSHGNLDEHARQINHHNHNDQYNTGHQDSNPGNHENTQGTSQSVVINETQLSSYLSQMSQKRVVDRKRRDEDNRLTHEQIHYLVEYWDHDTFVRLRSWALCFALLAVVLQIFVGLSGSWSFFGDAKIPNYSGLWSTCIPENNTCIFTFPFTSSDNGYRDSILCLVAVSSIFSIGGSGLSFTGLCVTALARKLYYYHSAGEIFFVSGMTMALAVSLYSVTVEVHFKYHRHRYGYTFWLAWIAAALLLLSALNLLMDELVQGSTKMRHCGGRDPIASASISPASAAGCYCCCCPYYRPLLCCSRCCRVAPRSTNAEVMVLGPSSSSCSTSYSRNPGAVTAAAGGQNNAATGCGSTINNTATPHRSRRTTTMTATTTNLTNSTNMVTGTMTTTTSTTATLSATPAIGGNTSNNSSIRRPQNSQSLLNATSEDDDDDAEDDEAVDRRKLRNKRPEHNSYKPYKHQQPQKQHTAVVLIDNNNRKKKSYPPGHKNIETVQLMSHHWQSSDSSLHDNYRLANDNYEVDDFDMYMDYEDNDANYEGWTSEHFV